LVSTRCGVNNSEPTAMISAVIAEDGELKLATAR